MKNPHVVPARAIHIRHIARNMREADVQEVAVAANKTPAQALAFSLRRSARAWTIIADGRPVAMFGVGDINILAGVGSPWMLGTDDVRAIFVPFLRNGRHWAGQLLDGYAMLTNFVDDRNTLSIRWLKWLGFTVGKPVAFKGQLFRKFEMRAD